MRIRIINPNTTSSMTAAIGAAARAAAGSGVVIEAVNPPDGPASIEGHYDEAVALIGLLAEVRKAEAEGGVDAYVIACFGDPGLDAVRELTRAPVIGVAEAAMRTATYLATGFSVVTVLRRAAVLIEQLVARYDMRSHCRSIRATDIAVLELADPKSNAYARVLAECRLALDDDRSGAIVLGCAGMGDLCERLSDELGVPVIDGVSAAVVVAEGLVRLGLGTSKLCDYAAPLPKAYTGTLAAFAPR